jgi:hypothetical protein
LIAFLVLAIVFNCFLVNTGAFNRKASKSLGGDFPVSLLSTSFLRATHCFSGSFWQFELIDQNLCQLVLASLQNINFFGSILLR